MLELGVGNGNQARVWLDEFLRLDRERGGQYYRRLHYLMGDYSAHVLERRRENVKAHAERFSSLALDARGPPRRWASCAARRSSSTSERYDNLPTDEIVRIGGHMYQVEVRASSRRAWPRRSARSSTSRPRAYRTSSTACWPSDPTCSRRHATDLFPKGNLQAVEFWQKVWDAVRLEERYVPIEGLDSYRVDADDRR